MRLKHFLLLLDLTSSTSYAQDYLSTLKITADNPVYTTYASSVENTQYSIDQGYQLSWFDPQKGIELSTDQSGRFGILFSSDNILKTSLAEFSQSPVITTTYSNLFKLFYYPFPGIKIQYTGIVITSGNLFLEVQISNETSFIKSIKAYPYIEFKNQVMTSVQKLDDGFSFRHSRKADSWMKEHNIPFAEKFQDFFISSERISESGTYNGLASENDSSKDYLVTSIKKFLALNRKTTDDNLVAFSIKLELNPGEIKSFRILRSLNQKEIVSDQNIRKYFDADISEEIRKNETLFNNLPAIKFSDKNEEAVYWNSFSLMRQCMMGPEGKCSYNYYVFSREPKWGWGYGGQVFHESLTMLAYAYLDPVSAMNSQRIYFERQHPGGYINYRTGPYLDEQIKTNGQLTSSAPWFNWQNAEIYKITKDKKFLKEAFESGRKYYEYYVSNRDMDKDGLCEWGGDAVLESVRDARAAVWDEVGEPQNFEAVDCNLMLLNEEKALSFMAAELGYKEETEKFRQSAEKRKSLINKYMWDEETGFYYNVNKKDHLFTFRNKNDLKRKEIIGFLALWAGAADKNQAQRLIEHFNNSKEFYRNYGIPTLSADDKYYNPIGYWNGPIWLPWQYLVFRGLLDYGYLNEAKDLTKRITANVSHQLSTNHYFWEFYSADDLQAGWNKAYIWSGIIARFYIDLNKY